MRRAGLHVSQVILFKNVVVSARLFIRMTPAGIWGQSESRLKSDVESFVFSQSIQWCRSMDASVPQSLRQEPIL